MQEDFFFNLGLILRINLNENRTLLPILIRAPEDVSPSLQILSTGSLHNQCIDFKIAVLVFKHHKIYSASDESILPLAIIFFLPVH